MEEQFVPHDLSLKLRELGFDGECFSWYYGGILSELGVSNPEVINQMVNHPHIKNGVKAPLRQQAFDWFREKGFVFTILPDIDPYTKKGEEVYCIEILQYVEEKQGYQCKVDTDYIYKSNRKTEIALLEKLIKICQEQKEDPEQKV